MRFSMERTWSESVGLVRERWIELGAVAIGLSVISALAALPFFTMWGGLLQPGIDPEVEIARISELMPRFMGVSLLANLVQLTGYCAMVALLGSARPPFGKALLHGLKAMPTSAISIIFLVVGMYVGIMVVVLVLVAVIAGLGAAQADPSLAAVGPAVVLFVLIYIGMLVAMLYFMVRFVTLLPVVVLERQYNPFTVLARSWKLTRGNGWALFGFFALLWIAMTVVYSAILFAVAWPVVRTIRDGVMPSVGAFVPAGLAMCAVGVATAMLLSAVVVSIHRQLTEEPPTEAE